ncbi:hypothetical protein E2C01_038260 [Portunus trituberculatus]|uniref:Uncharacterized protein n=1 Tax=Portunus trituberculatus TaxID=210409 RepID=A0A5B7FJH6_PORTR|nr:hypothetical protein [Portunus trituberculatus]
MQLSSQAAGTGRPCLVHHRLAGTLRDRPLHSAWPQLFQATNISAVIHSVLVMFPNLPAQRDR